jgi:hypothetical protein
MRGPGDDIGGIGVHIGARVSAGFPHRRPQDPSAAGLSPRTRSPARSGCTKLSCGGALLALRHSEL